MKFLWLRCSICLFLFARLDWSIANNATTCWECTKR